MNKKELLIPVGNMESLYMAVNNGADAVYFAYKKYGARSYANNFSHGEIEHAIKYCHLYGVKVYITVNTIIHNSEVKEFLEYIDFLYKNNVDALIVQDLGMIKLIREKYKDIELHASTQMHNTTEEDCKFLENLGVKRVVLARELSLDEINKIDTKLEKEIFIHGALCVCYSGCCLFSSRKTNRSANRGECVASCRLPYKLYLDNERIDTKYKYLLSTKELNTINNLDEILKSNVDSLKIEGRMKSPYYVGFITKLYREAMDSYYSGKKYVITNKKLNELKSLYNREFTSGFLFNDKNKMNIKSPNHKGYHIGEVISVDSKKIKIKLEDNLSQEDGIRFSNTNTGMIINKLYDEKGLLVNKVLKGNIAVVDNKINLNIKDSVYKTIDKELNDRLSVLPVRKIPIDIELTVKVGEKLKLTFKDFDSNVVSEEGVVIEKANTVSTTEEDLRKQIIKLGNTPFEVSNIKIDYDTNAFVPNKYLNILRRTCSEKLQQIRENIQINNHFNKLVLTPVTHVKDKQSLNVLVRNKEQLDTVIGMNVNNIYITDYELYKQYKKDNIYYVLPRVTNKYKDMNGENLVVRNTGSINKYSKNNNIVSDYTLNVVNKDGVELLNDLGVKRVCVSPESKYDEFDNDNYNKEILVYGKVELMISKFKIADMDLEENTTYYLEDEKKRKHKVIKYSDLTTIYDSDNINLIDKLDVIKTKFNNIRIDFLDEDSNEVKNIINRVRGLL